MRSRAPLLIMLVSLTGMFSSARADDMQLPNLRPLPASDLMIGVPDDQTLGEKALRFTTVVRNDGQFPFELLTGPPRGTNDLNFTALQCVHWVENRICADSPVSRQDVGDIYFDTDGTHFHFHFDDFARYELRYVRDDGSVDYSPAGLAAEERKESFCMTDTPPEDTLGNLDRYMNNPPFYLTCLGVLQGISPGWFDTYDWGLAGQQVLINGVPDHEYALLTILDPDNRIFESHKDDDCSVSFLRIVGNGTAVQPVDHVPEACGTAS